MITSKKEYLEYISYEKERYYACYKVNNEHKRILKFLKLYRKNEYYHNCHKNKLLTFIIDKKLEYYMVKYGFHLSINTIDKGLVIIHIGPIYINKNVKIGKNFKIHPMTTISSKLGSDKYPTIKDGVWVGPGAKIYGDITIGSNVVIGANSVVNKSIKDNVTVAGAPAKVINTKGYHQYFIKKD